ncbi:MAG: Bax inhibitor-1/YccA family protein [Desulfovibrio sp.]|nr:Bax inhibitor-1/YccA family protein [Desulfovibrio sp.]
MSPFQPTTTATSYPAALSAYMRQVYLWMSIGMVITGLVAWSVANTPALRAAVLGNSVVMIVLIIAQFGLVIALSAAIHKFSSSMATFLFALYSALTGATVSSIFLVYSLGSIASTFMVTAGTFFVMSLYGTITKRDLTGLGNFLFMGLIGIIIAMIVNMFIKNGTMNLIICCLGVLIFTGLTAYDTQRIRAFGADAPLDDPAAMRKGAILGALTLYLDFINMFLMMLQLFGGNRD